MRKVFILLFALVASLVSLPASAATAPSKFVKISEIDCHDEWIEIQNTHTRLSVNLKGYTISVIETGSAQLQDKYKFPNKVLKSGARLVLKTKALKFGFGCGDETVVLRNAKNSELDRTAIPNLDSNISWARFSTGWKAATPSLNKKNVELLDQENIDKAAWLYNNLETVQINLTITEVRLDKLVDDRKTYVKAHFSLVDSADKTWPSTGPLLVGVRTKGGVGSTDNENVDIRNGKIGLKIQFNEFVKGQRFLGLKNLTLNNMRQDASMVREVLSYQLFKEMGLVAPRTGFANVAINGVNRGLFLNLETYDEIMMARHRNKLGHLYDAAFSPTGPDCVENPWVKPEILTDRYWCTFQVDAGVASNISDLEKLAFALETQGGFSDDAKEILNMEQVAKFLAIEKFTNHWDGYSGSPSWTPNNFRLFSNRSGDFEFLPWGTDQTWAAVDPLPDWMINEGMTTTTEPFDSANGIVFNQCLEDEECKGLYLDALVEIVQIAHYEEFALSVFDAQGEARLADDVRFMGEQQALDALQATLLFMESQREAALDYVNSQR